MMMTNKYGHNNYHGCKVDDRWRSWYKMMIMTITDDDDHDDQDYSGDRLFSPFIKWSTDWSKLPALFWWIRIPKIRICNEPRINSWFRSGSIAIENTSLTPLSHLIIRVPPIIILPHRRWASLFHLTFAFTIWIPPTPRGRWGLCGCGSASSSCPTMGCWCGAARSLGGNNMGVGKFLKIWRLFNLNTRTEAQTNTMQYSIIW